MMDYDYNKIFVELQKDCEEKGYCNAFYQIHLADLIDLNYLLDRFLVFCDEVGKEELEDYGQCGDEILELRKLVITLFDMDLEQKKKRTKKYARKCARIGHKEKGEKNGRI